MKNIDATKTHNPTQDDDSLETIQWDPSLTTEIVASELSKVQSLFSQIGTIDVQGREAFSDLLNRGVDRFLGIKPTGLVSQINLDEISSRHARRILQVTLTERELGLPLNTLVESHSRRLDKLASPEEKRQAFEMCLASTNSKNLTAHDFEKAAKRVIEMRLARTNAANDESASSSEEEVQKSTTDKATRIYKKIIKNNKSINAGFYQTLLKSDNEDMEIIHALSSAKLSPDDRSMLALMLASLP